MNFIREMVSQKKNRFKQGKFNLDLTYITPRIIAMAYPASGMESLYRNKMKDVSEFLNTCHKDKYYIVNTSSRKYDYSKFNNKVIDIDWPNHHPCEFYYFSKLVLEITRLMIETSGDTVIVVHCLGGKGRTGSLIGCLLNVSGLFPTVNEANDYYLMKRGANVTYPSQIRYMVKFRYFFLNGLASIEPSWKELTSVSLKTTDTTFYENYVFNLSFYNFKKKKDLVFEKCFSAVFEELDNVRAQTNRMASIWLVYSFSAYVDKQSLKLRMS